MFCLLTSHTEETEAQRSELIAKCQKTGHDKLRPDTSEEPHSLIGRHGQYTHNKYILLGLEYYRSSIK